MQTTLLIMAAGIGSRFGEGIKQLSPIGPGGEIIIDYSIHDAIEAGFDQIVFVIRKDIEKDFRDVIGKRVEAVCQKHNVKVQYAFQSLEDIPASLPEGRRKPWGTGQAVLAARAFLNGPFAVINADDYYGKKAYRLLHKHLKENTDPAVYAIAGFHLGKTLSENGGVTRGICRVENEWVLEIEETKNVCRAEDGIRAGEKILSAENWASMNMWALPKESVKVLEKGFEEFFRNLQNPLEEEYVLPVFMNRMLEKKKIRIQLLPTDDEWFGVTYQQDRENVRRNMRTLIEKGVYAKDLYADLPL